MDQRDREFHEFVRTRTPALLRAAYLLTGDQHLAEDLVQSALARTHRAWDRLYQQSNAEAYARKVMYHLQVAWWRRSKVAETFPGDLPERPGHHDDHTDATGLKIVLAQALRQLTAKQRAVLVLRYFEDYSESESAEVLGVSRGTVKSQTARALGRLRMVAPELSELYQTRGAR